MLGSWMRRLTGAAALLVVVGLGTARAQNVSPYQGQAELLYDAMTSDSMDMTVVGVGGVYAFKSVDPGDGPLDESLFLARVPNAGAMLGFVTGEADMGGPVDLSGTEFGITAGYADENVPVGVDLMYTIGAIEMDMGGGVGGTVDMSGLDVKAGYFVMPGLIVGLSYELETSKVKIDGMGTVSDSDTTGIGLVGKWVQKLSGGTAVNAEISITSATTEEVGSPDETDSIVLLSGDYYLNQLIGVGLGLTFTSGDDKSAEGTALEIRARCNLNTKFGVGVSYETFTAKSSNQGEDSSTLTISVVGRF